jgi:hypothetical protein
MLNGFGIRLPLGAALVSAVALLSVGLSEAGERAQINSKLAFDSSDARLVESFHWAKAQALAYVFEGDPVGPWYEAALPGREAFCMRDIAHQSMGAHTLGLAPHTLNMLRRFAENISESRDWCSFWEINRYNRPAPADYKNDAEFWYCLPANYDVLDACYRMYLWTGDSAYINDPVFLNFYRHTVTDYEKRWSLDRAHVMQRKRLLKIRGDYDPRNKFQFFREHPSYDESRTDFVLGIDLLATQYAGYVAYAGIQRARGNEELAREYVQKAAALKVLINDSWWDDKVQWFYARLNENHQFEGHATSALLYRDAVDSGLKLKSTIGGFLDQIKRDPSPGIEGQSHNPEILYRYGQPDIAYSQILDLTRKDRERREYPEVSYAVIGSIVTGLMGISVNGTSQVVRTLSELGNIAWAQLRSVPVRTNEVTVRHERGRRTLFTNQRGPAVTWHAAFRGRFNNLKVDGKLKKAHSENMSPEGQLSFIEVTVDPGATVQVEIPREQS